MILDIPTPEWAEPLLQDGRYKCAYGGRGSGKSHFFGEYIIENHAADPSQSTVCVREVQKTLDQSVKRLLESKIESLNAGYYFTVLDAKIKSNFGDGVITFQGMQNHTADSIKSLEGYKRAWVEEAQTLSAYSLELLRPTIRLPQSEILLSWNPRYKTDPVDKLFRKHPPPGSIVVNVNWDKNPWFPDVLRKEMEFDYQKDPERAAHIWGGEYGSEAGAILARWVSQAYRDGRISDSIEYDPNGSQIEISSDLGFRDTASFWFWQRKPRGYALIGYDQDNGLDAQDWIPRIADTLKQLGGRLGKIWLPHDARAKTFQSKHTTIEQFLEYYGAGKVDIVPQTKKSDQISAARAVIGRCEFHKTFCERGLDGLEAWHYAFNEELQVYSKDPEHDWASHPADAFAYGCQVMQMYDPPKAHQEQTRGIEVGPGNTVTLEELYAMTPRVTNSRI